MGVSREHVILYGYTFDGRFDWDRLSEKEEYGVEYTKRLMGYSDAERGEFGLFQEPRRRDYLVAGIVCHRSDDVRWSGPQSIPVTVLDESSEPDDAKVEAMEELIDEEFLDGIERIESEPQFIVFTYTH